MREQLNELVTAGLPPRPFLCGSLRVSVRSVCVCVCVLSLPNLYLAISGKGRCVCMFIWVVVAHTGSACQLPARAVDVSQSLAELIARLSRHTDPSQARNTPLAGHGRAQHIPFQLIFFELHSCKGELLLSSSAVL